MINKHTTAKFSPGAAGARSAADAIGQALAGQGLAARRGVDGDYGHDGEEPGLNAIWMAVRDDLRRQLGEARFGNWIAGLELIAEVHGEVLFAAKSDLDATRVDQDGDLKISWKRLDPRRRSVRVDARERIPADYLALSRPAAVAPVSSEAVPVVERALGGGAGGGGSEDQTLENFIVGESNRIAFGLARRLAMGVSVAANVVTLCGPHGVGKTHLLKGIETVLTATRGKGSVLYMSAETFLQAFVDGVKRRDTSDLRAQFRRAKVVLLDDFQFICSGKPGTLTEFFSHLRAIVANGGVVVLACDQAPSALDQLDDRMRDEVQGGVVARIDLPERSLRREIVRAKADAIAIDESEFNFTEEYVDLLADRLPLSGRVLHGAVKNVFVGTVLANKPVDRPAVEKAISLALGAGASRPPKIDTIKDVTARAYNVTKADLESACRKRQFAQPRQYAMYLCRELTACSYPQIGRMFGERDHTTVLFAYRKISKAVKADEGLAEELRQLAQRILADPRTAR